MKRIIFLITTLILSLKSMAEPPVVQLLTASPGRDIYELEGHTALRIIHPVWGDFVVNWGVFDFDSPGFVYRFVKGETDYIAAAYPTDRFIASYARDGRTLRYQTLRLDSIQAERLTTMVMENLKPENRVYRYNYVLDNCATRPLAVIEKAIGDSLRFGSDGLRREPSFREAMRSYHLDYPWYQFGIDLALGSGIDRPISLREEAFAPVKLELMLDQATRPDGRRIAAPAVCLVREKDGRVLLPPTPWYLGPMFWSLVVLALALAVSAGQLRSRRRTAASRIFDSIYFTLLGLTGCVIAFLIFVSVHEATSPNWLFLWINPLCLTAAVAVWSKRLEKLSVCYQFVNFALLMALAVILLCGVQSPNPAFIPLMAADGVRALTTIYTYYRNRRCQHAKATR
ncbi:MAG: DUF4105 domain-containing protein [Duncaniella sp.]|nr:DUF4105 domain-containing protein [Duncaniella sp.]